MPKLKVMTPGEGHTVTRFTAEDAAVAAKVFDDAMGGEGRYRAYNVAVVNGKRESNETKEFDPNAKVTVENGDTTIERPVEEVLLVPPLAGG